MWKKLTLILCIVILAIATFGISKAADNASTKSKKLSSVKIRAADLSIAKGKIEHAVNKTATENKLDLSSEAKDVIAKEVIRRESDKGVPLAEISISYSESAQLVDAIATKAKGERVTAELVESAIAERKVESVKAMLHDEISRIAETSGIKVTEGARKLLYTDMLIQTERTTKSGLSINEIKSRNEGYLKAIYTEVPSKVLDEKEYKKAKVRIFPQLVRLTIKSDPPCADVETAGTLIGQTTIHEKRFEPEKEYVFIFKLSGHKTSVRKYFVTPHPFKQEFIEPLFKEGE